MIGCVTQDPSGCFVECEPSVPPTTSATTRDVLRSRLSRKGQLIVRSVSRLGEVFLTRDKNQITMSAAVHKLRRDNFTARFFVLSLNPLAGQGI